MTSKFRKRACIAFAIGALHLTTSSVAEEIRAAKAVLGLPEMVFPKENLGASAAIELGRRLFFDQSLSGDGKISCASCHIPEKAFTDGKTVAQGVGGRLGTRNTPSIVNSGYNLAQFWDGRRTTLERQVLDPILNPNEHGLANDDDLLRRIRQDDRYSSVFQQAFGTDSKKARADQVRLALAAYVRCLVAGDSPVDRYLYAGDKASLTPDQLRGLELFRGPAQCTTCHPIGERSALLTDNDYHSMAIGFDRLVPKITALARQAAQSTPAELDHLILGDPDAAAAGRFIVTRDPRDLGKFKTPSLRNVALTAPYMHDGSIATLEDVVSHEVYYRGQSMGRPLILTPAEKAQLVAFLRALTSSALPR